MPVIVASRLDDEHRRTSSDEMDDTRRRDRERREREHAEVRAHECRLVVADVVLHAGADRSRDHAVDKAGVGIERRDAGDRDGDGRRREVARHAVARHDAETARSAVERATRRARRRVVGANEVIAGALAVEVGVDRRVDRGVDRLQHARAATTAQRIRNTRRSSCTGRLGAASAGSSRPALPPRRRRVPRSYRRRSSPTRAT